MKIVAKNQKRTLRQVLADDAREEIVKAPDQPFQKFCALEEFAHRVSHLRKENQARRNDPGSPMELVMGNRRAGRSPRRFAASLAPPGAAASQPGLIAAAATGLTAAMKLAIEHLPRASSRLAQAQAATNKTANIVLIERMRSSGRIDFSNRSRLRLSCVGFILGLAVAPAGRKTTLSTPYGRRLRNANCHRWYLQAAAERRPTAGH